MGSFRGNTTLMKLQIKYQECQKLYRHFTTLWFTPVYHTVTSFGQALIQQALNCYSWFRKELLPFRNTEMNLSLYFYHLRYLTYELNTYLIALFMFSYFQWNLPNYVNNYVRLNETIHSHNSRSASNIHIGFKRTNYGNFALKYKFGMKYHIINIVSCF